jgi:predicted Rossmann fold flavoprotein
MAATQAAKRQRRTLLLDKNRRPGIKILLSGGTRCNLTHDTDVRGVIEAFGPNGRFLHSALAMLGPREVVALFESEGMPTKVEPGGKVFPASDRAADVLAILERRVKQSGCEFALSEPLVEIVREDAQFLLKTTQRTLQAEKIVLATGGQSYPACGTTGDGYQWAAALGHTIVPPRTALTPITSNTPWLTRLQGITMPDVWVQVIEPRSAENTDSASPRRSSKKPVCLASRQGSLLFTHFGVSGPVILDVSRAVSQHAEPSKLVLRCDFVPQLREDDLEAEIARQSVSAGRRRIASLLDAWTPRRLAETIVEQSGIPLERTASEFSKKERRQLAQTVKGLEIPVSGVMGFRKAEVTAGGVALKEVDSHTMQSRIVPGLFFAGELLDLDGPIGGYNFQAAFSTGWLAGESV